MYDIHIILPSYITKMVECSHHPHHLENIFLRNARVQTMVTRPEETEIKQLSPLSPLLEIPSPFPERILLPLHARKSLLSRRTWGTGSSSSSQPRPESAPHTAQLSLELGKTTRFQWPIDRLCFPRSIFSHRSERGRWQQVGHS